MAPFGPARVLGVRRRRAPRCDCRGRLVRPAIRCAAQVKFSGGKLFDEQEIMEDLSPRLRNANLLHTKQLLLEKVPMPRTNMTVYRHLGVADGMSIARVWPCRYSK